MEKYKECPFCGRVVVYNNFSKHIKACKCNPDTKEDLTTFVCIQCGKLFEAPIASDRKCCSRKCSVDYARGACKHLNGYKDATCTVCATIGRVNKHAAVKKFVCENCKKLITPKKLKKCDCKYCGRAITIPNLSRHEAACKSNPDKICKSSGFHRKDCKSGYIYMITNLINDKKYVGKRAGSISSTKSYYGSGIYIKRAIERYGKENFKKDILEVVVDGDLNERERYWIGVYETNITGYNLTMGGDGGSLFLGMKHSEETKNKIRQSLNNTNLQNKSDPSFISPATKLRRWTDEEEEEIYRYRTMHSCKETMAHFGITYKNAIYRIVARHR